MATNYVDLPAEGGGGGGSGAVDSVNGITGAVEILAGQGIDVNTFGQNITITAIGPSNTFAGFDSAGKLENVPGFNIDTTTGGLNEQITYQPNDLGGGYSLNTIGLQFDPLQNSPDDDWNLFNLGVRFDINSSGFGQGTSGEAVTIISSDIEHHGTGDIGSVSFIKNYADLGNGTDPITVRGLAYAFGFGDVNSGVTLTGPIQGYGFQPHIHAGAILPSSNDIRAFYDNSNVDEAASGGYTSIGVSANIGSIPNNKNFNGIELNPSIVTFDGNAGFTGVGIFPNITDIGSPTGGSFQGITIDPNIAHNHNYAAGINVNMNNVTNAPGTFSTLVVQDITYTFNTSGDNNNIQIRYTNTVVAGSEVANLSGNLITIQIESGVSTATQVRTAFNNNGTLLSAITAAITGTASNPQVTYSATNFAGGNQGGQKFAADFVGDVRIDGALSFTGQLTVGQIQAFANKDIATFPSGVNSIDQLITSPTLADNLTVTGVDLLGVNTAMLLNIGNNSHITTSFLGFAALGLPAVVTMGTGSTIDRVEGAAFAISLDGGGSGGTIGEVDLCRAIAIPNGVTTITRLMGFEFDLPFGDPGSTTWGVYMAPVTAHNFMAGDLKVGGTDLPANSSIGIELESTTKAIRFSNMTTVQKLALAALAGMMIFDTTLNQMSYFNGTSWVNF